MNIKIFDKYTKTMSDVFEISELKDWDLIWSDRFKGQNEISFCDLIWLRGAGRLDTQGIEIFEGDKIKMKSYNFPHLNNDEFEVKYDEKSMMFKFISTKDKGKHASIGFHSFTIIGNIYL